ncbi:uncharacterized protein LOC124437238 [Xenia sp. Carnegie-2017]|uniref:uncharacterized protein LOC124437238 n=1 Tax=Xenia sp. Carnegie-2017 TaxID=2897299 RepID=UPI001F033AB8|nr:uncharacterized protein LOC124437238 [Xenia sp. Carnegie-2017]
MDVQQAMISLILWRLFTHLDGSKDCEPGKYRVGFLEGPCHPCPKRLNDCKYQGSDEEKCKLSCTSKFLSTLTASKSTHSSSSSSRKQSNITISVSQVSKSWITFQTDLTSSPTNELSLSSTDLLLQMNHPATSDTTKVVLIAVFVLLAIIIVMFVLGCIYKHKQNVKTVNAYNRTITPIPRTIFQRAVVPQTGSEEMMHSRGNLANYDQSSF